MGASFVFNFTYRNAEIWRRKVLKVTHLLSCKAGIQIQTPKLSSPPLCYTVLQAILSYKLKKKIHIQTPQSSLDFQVRLSSASETLGKLLQVSKPQ